MGDQQRNVEASTSLEGTVERIVYANQETAWCVLKVAVPERGGAVTTVGPLLGVQLGEHLRLTGRWVVDRRYGEQFAAEGYVTIAPATLVGIERYLASGLVPGLGAVMARRLVSHFGLDTLTVIEEEPARIAEVAGIGPVRRARIEAAWSEQRALKEVMVFLQSHGVSTSHAMRIYRRYKARAVAVVREDPYRLVADVAGFGFKTADQIATQVGIAPTSPRRAAAGVLYVLEQWADRGHVFAPRQRLVQQAAALLEIDSVLVERALEECRAQLLVTCEDLSSDETGATDWEGHDEAVYLRELHDAEVGAVDRLAALCTAEPVPLQIELDAGLARLAEGNDPPLVARQLDAISRALTSKVMVLTGGPGTGKTTLLNGALALLVEGGARVQLCAPTGRAARRLAATTGHSAKTIHRLLEFSPRDGGFARDRSAPLEADFVMVDELSMVDIVLFRHLLEALPDACRVLLVGDGDQLPAVGPGSVLRDLVRSGGVEVVRLVEIFRQAAESRIVLNAHRVNAGESLLAEEDGTASDFYFIERGEPEAVLATLKELVTERIPQRFGLDPIDDVQVLSPMHKGLLGAVRLNTDLQALLNPNGREVGGRGFRTGDKVMQLRNNYDQDVYNGDIGRVLTIDEVDAEVLVRFDGRDVRYPHRALHELTLAYACSIHKAQGSEYPCVVMPLHTQHYVMLQRNLLYTGITRGRRLVVLVGSRRALAIAIKNTRIDERCTRLAHRLRDAVGGA